MARWWPRPGVAVVVGVLVLAAGAAALVPRRRALPALAAAIDARVPAGEVLTLCDPEYQPVVFYLRSALRTVQDVDKLPADARWVLTREEKRRRLEGRVRGARRVELPRAKGGEVALYEVARR